MAEAEDLAASLAASTFEEWAKFWTGKWSLTGARPEDSGVLTVSRVSGLQALTQVNNMGGGASLVGHAVTVPDPTTGMIKQTELYTDGTIEVSFIAKSVDGEWVWRQTRSSMDGQQETSSSTFRIGAGGNTALHNVSNRSIGGNSLPAKGHVLTRIG
jgi:hypothetical protein